MTFTAVWYLQVCVLYPHPLHAQRNSHGVNDVAHLVLIGLAMESVSSAKHVINIISLLLDTQTSVFQRSHNAVLTLNLTFTSYKTWAKRTLKSSMGRFKLTVGLSISVTLVFFQTCTCENAVLPGYSHTSEVKIAVKFVIA